MSEKKSSAAVIMFDGPDGIGKTTQLELANHALIQDGYDTYCTRVSGGTPIGEELRKVAFLPYERPVETDLYIALAQYHALGVKIRQERERGKIVLVDRSPLSIIAYQVYGSGLNKIKGFQGADETLAVFNPELIIVYSASKDILIGRRSQRKNVKTDYYENQPAAFMERVVEGYFEAAEYYKATVIDASGDIAAVHRQTMSYVINALPPFRAP